MTVQQPKSVVLTTRPRLTQQRYCVRLSVCLSFNHANTTKESTSTLSAKVADNPKNIIDTLSFQIFTFPIRGLLHNREVLM